MRSFLFYKTLGEPVRGVMFLAACRSNVLVLSQSGFKALSHKSSTLSYACSCEHYAGTGYTRNLESFAVFLKSQKNAVVIIDTATQSTLVAEPASISRRGSI